MDKTTAKLFPLSHLAAIAVSGQDNAKFLQGQLSCDINAVSDSQASLAAFCNPKGRVISTLLVVKSGDRFLLLLPAGLLDKVAKKLQIYILRSAVQLSTVNLTLFGLSCPTNVGDALQLPAEAFAVKHNGATVIRLPSTEPRYLGLADPEQPWETPFQASGFQRAEAEEWRYQDISAAFPWFEAEHSELYIPQMLNLDTMGGVSFNKGCYTGQEIIARTHYLGKAKRSLLVGECQGGIVAEAPLAVLDSETRQRVGDVIALQSHGQTTRLLLVMQNSDDETKPLILDDAQQSAVTILSIP